MINFPILRTSRFTAKFKELSIQDSIAIAKMPQHLEQASVTAFLRAVIAETSTTVDIAQWTVQERMLAVCHYISCVVDDGPNFAIGDHAAFLDYVQFDKPINAIDALVDVGELGGDKWQARHLTGAMVEAIELLDGSLDGITGRFHWLIGIIAAQLVRANEDAPVTFNDEWLLNRMRTLLSFPESDFEALSALFFAATEKLEHLFKISFDDDGIVALPVNKTSYTDANGKEAATPAARFRTRACLSDFAARMVGESG